MMRKGIVVLLMLTAACMGCKMFKPKPSATQFGVPKLDRTDFNRIVVLRNLPFYWMEDTNENGLVDPNELGSSRDGIDIAKYVQKGKFTEAFEQAYLEMVATARLDAVAKELDQGRLTLIRTDFTDSPENERTLVGHLMAAGKLIDELYQVQKGAYKYLQQIPESDTMSRALYHRNQEPWCAAPKTQSNPFCNAVASFPEKISDAYPEGMKQDEAMCKRLSEQSNAKELMDPFTVVRERGGKLIALPLTEVYGDRMRAVATELRAAAATLDEKEEAFKRYLLAAAKGFENNDWSEPDEAWAAMNSSNSKWFLRVAPDETYFDPCQLKAGFELDFGINDQSSLKWQGRLEPLKKDMEQGFADLIGPAYDARDVSFTFPDFVRVVMYSGDARSNLGAMIGQSLPNWGKVAEENRRRTMAMTNFYTDPDSKRIMRAKASSMLDASAMKLYPEDNEAGLITTILHEATHNFGPHSAFKVDGKTPEEIFGGRNAMVLEELKAQTGGIWFIDYLRGKGYFDQKRANEIYTAAIDWCFNHISRGMFTATGNPKAYSQLAAIQIGTFVRDGALTWVPNVDPQNDGVLGRFQINYDKLPASIEGLMRKTGQVMASGDAASAKTLIDDFTAGEGSKLVRMKEVEDRYLGFTKASFDFAVKY